jgi:hypothetical protein
VAMRRLPIESSALSSDAVTSRVQRTLDVSGHAEGIEALRADVLRRSAGVDPPDHGQRLAVAVVDPREGESHAGLGVQPAERGGSAAR